MRKKSCVEKGDKFEAEIKKEVEKYIPRDRYEIVSKKDFHECPPIGASDNKWRPDFLIFCKATGEFELKVIIECKYSETEISRSGSFESAMGKAYMMLNDLRLKYPLPEVHYFVVVNKEDDKRDYRRLFKEIQVNFVILDNQKDKRVFIDKIKRSI